jgi:hypothetical protein
MWLGKQKCGHFIMFGCHLRHDLTKLHYVGVDAKNGK